MHVRAPAPDRALACALACALILAGCAGDEAIVFETPVPDTLAVLDAGLEPAIPEPLEIPTAWLRTRNAASAQVVWTTATPEVMDAENPVAAWADAETTLMVVSELDDGTQRWEAALDRRSNGRGLLYYFEIFDDTSALRRPEAGVDDPLRVEAEALVLDFAWPDWPAMRTPLACPADRTRVFDGAEDEATLAPGAPFDVIREGDFRDWTAAQSVIFNNENLPRGYGVEVDGQAYFFPHVVMLHHEVANHRFGDRQLVMTYCPLTDTGWMFDTGLDPDVLPKFHDFAPAGLYNSNVMVSIVQAPLARRTLYSQMLTWSVRGVNVETCPPTIPSVQVDFPVWRQLHPETLVLAGDPELLDRYDYRTLPNPYREYWTNPAELRSEIARTDDRLPNKQRVLGVIHPTAPLAVELTSGPWALNETAGDVPVAVLYAKNTAIALERIHPLTGATIELRRTTGNWGGMPLYEDDSTEPSLWSFEGVALDGPAKGERLAWMPSMSAFWFAWYAIYPESRLMER